MKLQFKVNQRFQLDAIEEHHHPRAHVARGHRDAAGIRAHLAGTPALPARSPLPGLARLSLIPGHARSNRELVAAKAVPQPNRLL